MDYQEIKATAKEIGTSIKELIALAPQNDPFYTGSKSELAKAEWFAGLWRQFGYGRGVHLRRVHYQVVSQDPPVVKPNGKPYENTLNDWAYLNLAAKYARYLELVPARYFVDRRNPEAIVNARWSNPGDHGYEDLTPGYGVEGVGWDNYTLPDLPELDDLPDETPDLPSFQATGYASDWDGKVPQDYHVEVWAEKTTMNDVLEPLCRRYKANLVTGAGELSITAVIDLMERVKDAQRPARILYISDYDPAGLGMPISVARKIEYFQTEHGYGDLDIGLQPIILIKEQVAGYDLPRVPVKDSDKRKAHFEAAHGVGQVELDALEALHPGELGRIVQEAILDYYDPKLTNKARQEKERLQETLDGEWEQIVDAHQDEIDDLGSDYDDLWGDFAGTRERFSELVAEFQPEIDAHKARLEEVRKRGQELYSRLLEELGEVDVDLEEYPMPEPNLPQESNGKLYDSKRGYFGQLEYYKHYRNGTN
jgi:hypothetical protein